MSVQLDQEGLPASGRRHSPATDNACQAAWFAPARTVRDPPIAVTVLQGVGTVNHSSQPCSLGHTRG
jgi:hypothetical protein